MFEVENIVCDNYQVHIAYHSSPDVPKGILYIPLLKVVDIEPSFEYVEKKGAPDDVGTSFAAIPGPEGIVMAMKASANSPVPIFS